jgi:hypothetical protein
MLMTIRYQSGLRAEAVVLAADHQKMRVVVDSQRDTMELHKVDACWQTEDGAEIEIEALIPLEGTNVLGLLYPATIAAGHGCR